MPVVNIPEGRVCAGHRRCAHAKPFRNGWILNAAPIVFVVGLLSLTSCLVFWGSNRFLNIVPNFLRPFEHPESNALCCSEQPMGLAHIIAHYWALLNPHSALLLVLAAALLYFSR